MEAFSALSFWQILCSQWWNAHMKVLPIQCVYSCPNSEMAKQLPGGTKPLLDTMLIYHQLGPSTVTHWDFHKIYLSHQSLKFSFEIIHIEFYSNMPGDNELKAVSLIFCPCFIDTKSWVLSIPAGNNQMYRNNQKPYILSYVCLHVFCFYCLFTFFYCFCLHCKGDRE